MRSINREAVPHHHACPIHNVADYEGATACQIDGDAISEFREFDARNSKAALAA